MVQKLPENQEDLKNELEMVNTKIKHSLDECGACQGRSTFLGWESEQKLELLSDIIFLQACSNRRSGPPLLHGPMD